MLVLGLDTCLAACSVALVDGERVLACASEPMERGHQERLAPMVQAVMAEAQLPFAELQRIGVTIGPGSFTGLRVGLAFAKGLASALSAPLAGVGVLEALAAEAAGLAFAAVDARRGQVYLQGFEDGRPLMAPDALELPLAAARLAEIAGSRDFTLVGSGATLLAQAAPGARMLERAACDPILVARLAAAAQAASPAQVRPLYLRGPDARLPA
jgi:tRNA threonylcarbamoyladenosine biosynthesis protein TsaB